MAASFRTAFTVLNIEIEQCIFQHQLPILEYKDLHHKISLLEACDETTSPQMLCVLIDNSTNFVLALRQKVLLLSWHYFRLLREGFNRYWCRGARHFLQI